MDSQIAQKVEDFFSQYRPRQYAKGQILIHADDNPETVFNIVRGHVKQYDISYRGDEVVLNIFSAPAFFPMSYAINKTPNKYFFEAETDVELRLAPVDDVVKFIEANHDVAYDLLARVYRGLDGILGRMAHLMSSSAKSRVMYELLIEGRRFGTKRGGQTAVVLNEGDIGSRSGLARETVNREMQKLKKEGFISVASHEIIIKDIENLSEAISAEL